MSSSSLMVSGGTLLAATGETPVGLYGAVAGGLSVLEPLAGIEVPIPGGAAPALGAPLEAGAEADIGGWLAEVCAPLAAASAARRHLHLLLPPADAALTIDERDVLALLGEVTGLESESITCARIGAAPLGGLTPWLEALAEARIDTLLFAGADSLLDVARALGFAGGSGVLVRGRADGVGLGEGAACVRIERHEGKVQGAVLAGWSQREEPDDGRAGETRLQSAAALVAELCEAHGIAPTALDAVVHELEATAAGRLEWIQVLQTHWQACLDEPARLAMQLGERPAPQPAEVPRPPVLALYPALGSLGAATLPLQFILAAEHLRGPWAETGWVCGIDAQTAGWRAGWLMRGAGGETEPSTNSTSETGIT